MEINSLLQNKIEFSLENKVDLVVIPYYIDVRTINLKVYSVGAKGWNPFEVRIYGSQESDSPICDLRIPKSTEWSGSYTIITNFDLSPLEDGLQPKIPKNIMQTASETQITDPALKNTENILRSFNPDYKYYQFSDELARSFMLEYGPQISPKVMEAYDTLIPSAFKADLFRYVYLYFFGGWYFDYKLVLRMPIPRKYSNETLVLCADYERSNSPSISGMDSVYTGVIGTIPKDPLFLKLVMACVHNVLDRQQEFLDDIDRRGVQGILDLTGPKLFYTQLSQFPEYEKYIKMKHFIKNRDESTYINFQINDLDSSDLLMTKFGTGETPPKHYSLFWAQKMLFFRDIQIVTADTGSRYKILVYPKVGEDGRSGTDLKFSIDDKVLSMTKMGAKKNEILAVRVIDKDNKSIDVLLGCVETDQASLGDREPTLRSKQMDFFDVEKIQNIFYIDQFSRDKITQKNIQGIIVITSVIFTSANSIGVNEVRSFLTPQDRYNQTVEQLEILRRKAPDSILILLESSLRIPKKMLNTFARIVDYVIVFFDQNENPKTVDPDRMLYFHQHPNKTLGELYSLVSLYDKIKGLDFTHFMKLSGRYCPNPDFELDIFLAELPVSGHYKGECETVFYSIPKKYIHDYIEYIRTHLNPKFFGSAEGRLTLFMRKLNSYYNVESLRITGIGATHGKVMKL